MPLKGFRHTEETKEKISATNKGRNVWNKGIPRTDEEKHKISESNKGKVPWNKGIPRSEETKRKISKVHKGKIPWNKGIEHTDETKKKISESRKNNPHEGTYKKGHSCSSIVRKKISESNTGHATSEEHRRKISLALKGIKRPPRTKEHCRKLSEAHKGKVISKETREKLRVVSKGRKHSDETMKKLTGENSVHWKGGISFEPYCPKFNKKFKESIRNKFERKCFLCNKPETDNGKKLCVHHVNYDKNCLCNDIKCEFVPLCNSCHSKTNNNREYYENMITEKLLSTRNYNR